MMVGMIIRRRHSVPDGTVRQRPLRGHVLTAWHGRFSGPAVLQDDDHREVDRVRLAFLVGALYVPAL